MLAGLVFMMPKASAGCGPDFDYGSSSSYGYNFLEIKWWKISVYDDKVTLNINVKFARRSYGWCAYSFEPIKRDTAIKVSCQLSRHNDITLKGKLADTMDAYAYEWMIIGKITSHSTIDDMIDFLDANPSRIRCGVVGNDTVLKLKIVDKRDI